ncbi:MAG: HPF/RaiA family ribosome-associated protein [Acidobacteriota bacterium]
MNLKIQPRNLEIPARLERLIQTKALKVRRLLPSYDPEVFDLHVTLERLPRGNQHQTTLLLTIPQKTIRVDEVADNPVTSVKLAYDEMLRRVRKFKTGHFFRRQPARIIEPVNNEIRELESAINQNLDKIENYIRREIYHRMIVENLPPGLLQVQAVVDEVFLKASSMVATKPENLAIEQWMFQIARDTLEARISSLEDSREDSHIEDSPRAPERWDDELLNFHQPDEVLHLEDLLRDSSSTNPEELLAREETEELLHKAVAHLPRTVRESFVLFVLEGFNSDEVAMMTGRSTEKVIEEVEKARSILRETMERALPTE